MSEAPDLRERLLAMRESLVDGLASAPHIDGGHLALLGHIGAALDALPAVPGDAEAMARVVVVDDPSQALRLVMHGSDGRTASAPVSPQRALAIAGELIAAALRRLA